MNSFWDGFEKQAGIGGAVKSVVRSGISPKAVASAAPKMVGPMPAKGLSQHAQRATANITQKNYASIPDVAATAAPKKKLFGIF